MILMIAGPCKMNKFYEPPFYVYTSFCVTLSGAIRVYKQILNFLPQQSFLAHFLKWCEFYINDLRLPNRFTICKLISQSCKLTFFASEVFMIQVSFLDKKKVVPEILNFLPGR